jgi:hypothetical protein
MMRAIKSILITGLGLVLLGMFIYGTYWVTKTVSYSFFYEDMVKRTIVHMVKPESLKGDK